MEVPGKVDFEIREAAPGRGPEKRGEVKKNGRRTGEKKSEASPRVWRTGGRRLEEEKNFGDSPPWMRRRAVATQERRITEEGNGGGYRLLKIQGRENPRWRCHWTGQTLGNKLEGGSLTSLQVR